MESNAGMRATSSIIVKDWLTLFRLPFHTLGIFPLVLSTALAI